MHDAYLIYEVVWWEMGRMSCADVDRDFFLAVL